MVIHPIWLTMGERTKEIRLVVVKLAAVLSELLVLTRPSSGCKLRGSLDVRQDRPKLVVVKVDKEPYSVAKK